MLGYLENAFLIRPVALATESERRRSSNPRKLYPVDPGLAAAFDVSGRPNTGHALETAVLHEADRRSLDVAYLKTADGLEVDFLLRVPGAAPELIRVCADVSDPGTLERELRALQAASAEHPGAARRLLVLDRDQVPSRPPAGIHVQPVYEWLLDGPAEG